ncbi:MAG TPA: hypothetical protein VF302_06240 [Candidatus Limnocylindrales bacterium]|jgi:hypothetical protein
MVPSASGAVASFTFPTAGTYILQLQYQTKSIAGTAAPNPINPTYTFDTGGFPADDASIQLFKHEQAARRPGPDPRRSEGTSNPLCMTGCPLTASQSRRLSHRPQYAAMATSAATVPGARA